MPWSPEVEKLLLERFQREAVPWMERRTVIVYLLMEHGDPVPVGSGVLLQVADRSFLLTAAHNFKHWGEARYVISLQENGVIDLTTVEAQVTRDRDDVDFAILPLRLP